MVTAEGLSDLILLLLELGIQLRTDFGGGFVVEDHELLARERVEGGPILGFLDELALTLREGVAKKVVEDCGLF